MRQFVDEFTPERLERICARTREMVRREAMLGKRIELHVLPQEHETVLFRTCRELLTNVTRHADATTVHVRLGRNAGEVRLEVSDDGRGISEREVWSSSSLRLVGLRERVPLLHGRRDVRGEPGKGTAVRIAIPWHRAERKRPS